MRWWEVDQVVGSNGYINSSITGLVWSTFDREVRSDRIVIKNLSFKADNCSLNLKDGIHPVVTPPAEIHFIYVGEVGNGNPNFTVEEG